MKQILKFFKKVKKLVLYKNLNANLIILNDYNLNNFFIKKIFIWILCKEKKHGKICKRCLSCINFLNNNYPDYISLYDTSSLLEDVYFFTKIHPIISDIRILILSLNEKTILFMNKIVNIFQKLDNTSFLIVTDNIRYLFYDKNLDLFFIKKTENKISISILKYLYKFFNNKSANEVFMKNKIDKIQILNSFIFFLSVLINNNKKTKKCSFFEKIILNHKRNILKIKELIKISCLYRKLFIENTNLNINLFICFFLEYIKKI